MDKLKHSKVKLLVNSINSDAAYGYAIYVEKSNFVVIQNMDFIANK
jgi:hypothetical protein